MDQPPEHDEGQVRASAAVDQPGGDIPLARRLKGVNVIDFSDPLPFLLSLRPDRKLLAMVLLLALKDGASVLGFEPCEPDSEGPDVRMYYEVEGVSYDLVPPPRSCCEWLACDLKEIAGFHPVRRRLAHFLRRLAHLIDGDGDLAHSRHARFRLKAGADAVDVSVTMTPATFGDRVLLHFPACPAALRRLASDALRDLMAIRKSQRTTGGS
jgi:hypothetical protein